MVIISLMMVNNNHGEYMVNKNHMINGDGYYMLLYG